MVRSLKLTPDRLSPFPVASSAHKCRGPTVERRGAMMARLPETTHLPSVRSDSRERERTWESQVEKAYGVGETRYYGRVHPLRVPRTSSLVYISSLFLCLSLSLDISDKSTKTGAQAGPGEHDSPVPLGIQGRQEEEKLWSHLNHTATLKTIVRVYCVRGYVGGCTMRESQSSSPPRARGEGREKDDPNQTKPNPTPPQLSLHSRVYLAYLFRMLKSCPPTPLFRSTEGRTSIGLETESRSRLYGHLLRLATQLVTPRIPYPITVIAGRGSSCSCHVSYPFHHKVQEWHCGFPRCIFMTCRPWIRLEIGRTRLGTSRPPRTHLKGTPCTFGSP
ncbi:hypothetical protein LX32DRAFT_24360 [Colletotrichum zoysiae]|uniref:Uncharacterized protein n=1 Tax=Colletotrichum zoysiae TaxID=1216348 RepID=A0AAD9HRJ0_9PEZI|nr:hypothetical protein LX32DRAFT_24360 [Colletotrichum zoysiae]